MTKKKLVVNDFIFDEVRKAYLNAIDNRIRRHKSVLLLGKFGCGKTELLKQVKPKGKRVIRVNSLGSPYQILGTILQVTKPLPANAFAYMLDVCKLEDTVVILDEANLLKRSVYPYLKQCMDSKISFVLAGKPEIEDVLKEKFEDILSRLKVLELKSLSESEYKQKYAELMEPDALSVIYAKSMGNMRKFEEIVEDCLDFAQGQIVTTEIVEKFL